MRAPLRRAGAIWPVPLSARDTVAVIHDFVFTPEYRKGLVDAWYQAYFHRPADTGGEAYFTSLLNQGLSQQQIEDIAGQQPKRLTLRRIAGIRQGENDKGEQEIRAGEWLAEDWAGGFIDAVLLRQRSWTPLIKRNDGRALLMPILLSLPEEEVAVWN